MTHGIGIIGTGWGARVQVPAFRAAGLEVTALAGSQAAKTERVAGELEVAFHSADWRALLARPDVTLVSIVTPPALHREMALAALEAGKHVLCEKPTAMNAAEAEAMLEAARQRPHQLALIDHELRFLPVVRRARELVAAGAIGTLRHAAVRFVNNGRADPTRPWNWWYDASQGGGALGAIGSHQVDLLRYLLDDEVAEAHGFVATAIAERPDKSGQPRAVSADDYAAASLRFAGGALANLLTSAVAGVSEPNSLSIHGSQGTLNITSGRLFHNEPGKEPVDLTPAHTVAIPQGIAGEFPEGTVYLGHALRAYLDGDGEALALAATFADGLAVQRTLDAIRSA